MDDKYFGCNIVESAVDWSERAVRTENDIGQSVDKSGTHFFLRFFLAVVIIGIIASLHYFGSAIPYSGEVCTALRKVFCYDVFGRSEFGITDLFG